VWRPVGSVRRSVRGCPDLVFVLSSWCCCAGSVRRMWRFVLVVSGFCGADQTLSWWYCAVVHGVCGVVGVVGWLTLQVGARWTCGRVRMGRDSVAGSWRVRKWAVAGVVCGPGRVAGSRRLIGRWWGRFGCGVSNAYEDALRRSRFSSVVSWGNTEWSTR